MLMTRLDQLFTVESGLSTHYLSENGVEVPLLKMKDIPDGSIDTDSVERVKVRKTPLLDKSKIRIGDVIITTRGTNFRAIVADKSIENFVISSNLVILRRYQSNEVDPEIVAAYLNSTLGQRELRKWATGAGIMGMNVKRLKEVLIPILDHGYQKNLSYYLSLARERKISLMKDLELQEMAIDAIFMDMIRR